MADQVKSAAATALIDSTFEADKRDLALLRCVADEVIAEREK